MCPSTENEKRKGAQVCSEHGWGHKAGKCDWKKVLLLLRFNALLDCDLGDRDATSKAFCPYSKPFIQRLAVISSSCNHCKGSKPLVGNTKAFTLESLSEPNLLE